MRQSFNPVVREIMEELQGSTVQHQSAAMPTPGQEQVPGQVKKPGVKLKPSAALASKAAGSIQAIADKAAQDAAAGVSDDMAQQQGIDPEQQKQINKNLKAQPKPTRSTATAASRGIQGDAIANRAAGLGGKPVQATEGEESDKKQYQVGGHSKLFTLADAKAKAEEIHKKTGVIVSVEEVKKTNEEAAGEVGGVKPPLPKDAEDVLTNPDAEEDYNEKEDEPRADQRAKEVFPGAKDMKVAGHGKHGAGNGQCHHEVTNPRQTTVKKTDEKEPTKTEETVLTP